MRISDWSSDVCSSDLLDRLRRAAEAGPRRTTLSCGNLAHGFAACGLSDKQALKGAVVPNLAIITAYNDMLSAHQPFERFPEIIRQAALLADAAHMLTDAAALALAWEIGRAHV